MYQKSDAKEILWVQTRKKSGRNLLLGMRDGQNRRVFCGVDEIFVGWQPNMIPT